MITMRAPHPFLRAVPAFLLALTFAGCAPPLQNGGVTIFGDPGTRLATLCRFRHHGDDGFCANDTPEVKPARTRRIAGPNDGLHGPFATGRAGDYVLENDEIAVVIDQLDGGQGIPQGGTLVDAADARTRRDALGQIVASFGGPENHAVYEKIATGTGSDGSAYVQVEGHAIATPAMHVVTRYALTPGSRVVTITTTLLALGDQEITGLDLGDTVLWGGATSGAPAPQRQEGDAAKGDDPGPQPRDGESAAPYVFGVGEDAAYALVKDGRPFVFRNDASTSVVVLERGVTLSPSKPFEYSRALVVAPRGDTAAVATELFYLGGGAPGGVEVAASWDGTVVVRPHENRIVLHRTCADCGRGAAPSTFPDPPSLWLDQPVEARAAGELAPGKYTARFEGSAGSSAEVPFEVKAGAVTKVTLPVVQGTPPQPPAKDP
jgi:hypothetical protein